MIKGIPSGEVPDDKRFYLGGVTAHFPCPSCGEEAIRDFGINYLSYPHMNVPFTTYVHCSVCDEEDIPIEVMLTVRLEAVENL